MANTCPVCNKMPDVPKNKSITLWSGALGILFSSRAQIEFYCNYCGSHLNARILRSKQNKYNPEHKTSKFIHASEILAEDFEFTLWISKKKKIFISYSHMDDTWCRPFAQSFREKGYEAFYDDGSIARGADWIKSIGEAIEDCHFFIVVLTPNSWTSDWVQKEMNQAFAARKEMLPVLYKDTQVSGIMRTIQWADVRGKSPEDAASLVISLLNKDK